VVDLFVKWNLESLRIISAFARLVHLEEWLLPRANFIALPCCVHEGLLHTGVQEVERR